jgi:hypothetical protein
MGVCVPFDQMAGANTAHTTNASNTKVHGNDDAITYGRISENVSLMKELPFAAHLPARAAH